MHVYVVAGCLLIKLVTSGGLRNVRTVRSHRPPLKEKAPLKKNHRVNYEKFFSI